ncbi:uncharacterized protein LAJ45_01704 [Morchella importuna]|nr:uncharacterized protein LAJ45_01704 [Morchella importuna]KAH8153937.1 hypothetical protein LAJ45_01704 [Morchella importuna]
MLNTPQHNHDPVKLKSKYYDTMTSSSHHQPYSNSDFYGFAAAFSVSSSPPAPVGQPLLDTQEKSEFDNWIDGFNTNTSSVDPSHIYSGEISAETSYWPDIPPSNYQASDLSSHHGYMNTNIDGYLGSNSVSSAPSMAPPQVDINPFSNNHDIHQRQHEHSPSQLNNHSLLNFGTDTNFAPTGYHPPPPAVQLDKDIEIRSKIYTAFPKNDSAVTTAVNSPAEVKYERNGEDTEEEDENGPYYRDDDNNSTSPSIMSAGGTMKRRVNGMDDYMSSKSRKARPRKSDAAARAAKKKTAGAKRDNLTEAQKRENHIHSEQKRRNLIRQGFEELCSMVPELNTGGYSKSAVLIHAANYLEELKKGNERLRNYLHHLQKMEGRAY